MSALDELLAQLDDPSDIPWAEETYDTLRASDLRGEERATYIARLMQNAREGDPRAILSLGHLEATEALPMLEADAKSEQPWAQMARRALTAMGHGQDVLTETVNDALHAPAKMARVAAVLDLSRIGGPVAIDALLQALEDRDDAVRMLASDGLVALFELEKHYADPEGIPQLRSDLEIDTALISSDLRAFVALGAKNFRATIAKLRSGSTPRSLGIEYAPFPDEDMLQRLRLALLDATPFPVDAVAKLTGPHRRLCEMMIGNRLLKNDTRAPEALVQLGAEWTAPAMDEVAAGSGPAAYRELCKQCARALRGS